MPTTRPTLAPDSIAGRASVVPYPLDDPRALFFDDVATVMYRKIDTTPLFATSPQRQLGSGASNRIAFCSSGLKVERDRGCVVSLLIPSRMTHRPLFALAGAPSERMKP
jgi:hypothetical protein